MGVHYGNGRRIGDGALQGACSAFLPGPDGIARGAIPAIFAIVRAEVITDPVVHAAQELPTQIGQVEAQAVLAAELVADHCIEIRVVRLERRSRRPSSPQPFDQGLR
jgi:hypothetical protein